MRIRGPHTSRLRARPGFLIDRAGIHLKISSRASRPRACDARASQGGARGGSSMKRRTFLAGASGALGALALGCGRTALAGSKRHRIAVVGRGPWASAAARHLAEAGEDVVLIGPEEPADYAHHSGPFASHYDEGRQVEFAAHNEGLSRLTRAASHSFRALQANTGIEFYRDWPNLYVAPRGYRTDYLDFDQNLALAQKLGAELVDLDDAGIAARFPMFRFPANSRGLVEPRGGIINPRRMVHAQLAAARKAGAALVADEVIALREKPGQVELVTRGGQTLGAERALIATGGFTNASGLLARKLVLPLYGVTAVLVEAKQEPRPEIPTVTFTLGPAGAPRTGFAMPPLRYPDGRHYLKCATASSVTTPLGDAELGTWFRGAGRVEDGPEIAALLREVLPGFEPGAVRTLPCMVSYTATGLPYVDRVSARVGIACGCNANGVMSSDEIGRLAAAMMRDAPWTGPISADQLRAHFV
jgi:sarcosine oxidase